MSLGLDKSAWKRVAFGDVAKASKEPCDPSDGSVDRYIAGEHMDTDELKIRRWGDIGDGYLGPAFHRRFRVGQVLYGSRRTYLRKVAVAEFDGVCANTTFVIETRDENVLLRDFLPFVMTSEPFHAFAIAESKGSVNPYVNWSDIARYEFDLPPLDEQQRIADLLWAIEKHWVCVSAIDAAGESLTEPLMSRSTYGSRTVADVVSIARSGATPSRSNKDFYGGDIPWLKSGEADGDGIVSTSETITRAGLDGSAAWLVPAGAIVVAMYGDGKTRGQVGRIATQMATNQAVLALVPDRDKCDPDFLYYWMRSRQGHLREKSGGAAQKNLSKALVTAEPFPDLTAERQGVVARTLSKAQTALAMVADELRALRRLRAAVLVDIFGDTK
jgi:type I restriction enzyme S subunit